jgi:hypothetical protein
MLSDMMRFSTFMANLVEANSNGQIEQVVEKFALPVGSYTLKQKNDHSLFVNGYLGYVGDLKKNFTDFRMYAPIGLSYNCRLGKNKQCGVISLFGSIFDIGGLTAYRFDHETDTLKQSINLKSIFSPSIQLQYEFPKVPILISVGVISTPPLFYSGKSLSITSKPKWILSLSVLVDIPIFQFKVW